MHQYAYYGKGKTIHSSGQIEWFKNDVNDKSIKVGGQQRILTNDGYVIPINIRNGLPYMLLRPYTNKEWDDLPHIILTSDVEWDPTVLDEDFKDNEKWFDAQTSLDTGPNSTLFDANGDYLKRTVVGEHDMHFFDADSHNELDNEDLIHYCVNYYLSNNANVTKK